MKQNFTQYAFTDSVKKMQLKYGTRQNYAQMEQMDDKYLLSKSEKSFIQARDSFYMATLGENGWPYVQHRGGPKGFLQVIDEANIAYADFRGNGQYISVGNLQVNQKASLILIDYPAKRRLKLWTEVTILDAQEHPDLSHKLAHNDYQAIIERIHMLRIKAYDWNCPQHITARYSLEEAQALFNLNESIP